MASFFRGTCAIYWITWLTALAFLIGISVYENTFIIYTEEYGRTSYLMKVLCLICIVYSFVGCIFVKCDISHIGCVLLFIIPLFLVGSLSGYGIYLAKNVPDFTPANLTTEARIYWKEKRRSPLWLEKMEFDTKCCGILSWRDYNYSFPKEEIYAIYGKHPLILNGRHILVPISCCASMNDTEQEQPHCLLDPKLHVKNFTLVGTSANFSRTVEEEGNDTELYKEATDPDFPILNPINNMEEIINVEGCGKAIKFRFQAAVTAHENFFIVLIICCLLMILVYGKNWCDSRHFNGGHSDHSLDVETLSLLDIPALTNTTGGEKRSFKPGSIAQSITDSITSVSHIPAGFQQYQHRGSITGGSTTAMPLLPGYPPPHTKKL